MEPVKVIYKNGAEYTCTSETQLESFLEDGWKVVEVDDQKEPNSVVKTSADTEAPEGEAEKEVPEETEEAPEEAENKKNNKKK